MKRKLTVAIIISAILFSNATLPSLAATGFLDISSDVVAVDQNNMEPEQETEAVEESSTEIHEVVEDQESSTEIQEVEDDQQSEVSQNIDRANKTPLFSNKAPNINTYVPENKNHTSQLGSQSVFYIDGISFSDLDAGIYDYGIKIGTNGDPTIQIDKIVIPPLHTTEGQSALELFVMGMYTTSIDWVVDPVVFEQSQEAKNQPVVITREDMLLAGTEGEYPSNIRIIFGLENEPLGKMTELIQTAPIEVHYTTIGYGSDLARPYDPIKKPKEYYQYIKVETSWYHETPSDRVTKSDYHYTFFNTLDVISTADKQDNLKPGDEVEVTFNIKNNSEYIHRYQNLGFILSGLEVVEEESQPRMNVDEKTYEMKLVGADGKMLNFEPLGEDKENHVSETTITKTFKVTNDAAMKPIKITPYTYFDNQNTYRYESERNYHDVLEFTLATETTRPETGTPGTGTPGTGTPGTGTSETGTTESVITEGTTTETEGSGEFEPATSVPITPEMPTEDGDTDHKDNTVRPLAVKPKPVTNNTLKSTPSTGDSSIPLFVLAVALVTSSIILIRMRENKKNRYM